MLVYRDEDDRSTVQRTLADIVTATLTRRPANAAAAPRELRLQFDDEHGGAA
jgi:hypothetical protein